MNTLRLSDKTAWLNRRLIHFPHGARAIDIFASLAKHSPALPKVEASANKKRKASAPYKRGEHPCAGIASVVAWRLENPTNRQFMARKVQRLSGSNQHKAKIANDGKLRGFVLRSLSPADFDEICGIVGKVIAETGAGAEDKISLSAWKRIFTEARATLRIDRKYERAGAIESLESIDFHSELTMPSALIAELTREREEEDEREAFCRRVLAAQARKFLAYIHAAFRADDKMQRRKAKNTALRYLLRALRAFRGNGHSSNVSREHAYTAHKRFLRYIDKGEAQFRAEDAAACDAAARAEEAACMFGISA